MFAVMWILVQAAGNASNPLDIYIKQIYFSS